MEFRLGILGFKGLLILGFWVNTYQDLWSEARAFKFAIWGGGGACKLGLGFRSLGYTLQK